MTAAGKESTETPNAARVSLEKTERKILWTELVRVFFRKQKPPRSKEWFAQDTICRTLLVVGTQMLFSFHLGFM